MPKLFVACSIKYLTPVNAIEDNVLIFYRA
jgi:hypothetical protein